MNGSSMITTVDSNMISEDASDSSSAESPFDDSELLQDSVGDVVTSQLVSSGPIGIAAAAAICTGKKRKRPHLFEINPSIRKRQQTRLLRKLRSIIEEYTSRVGQQAVVLTCIPSKTDMDAAFKVFGSQPLENVVRNNRNLIMQDLEANLAQHTPSNTSDKSGLHELPPLAVDGIPTPVEKMTQAQLRAFIPEMLKYSTGQSKPGWGKSESRPLWWPPDVPWANVRSDVRTDEEKKNVSWTHALRTIVRNCYAHHGREDLLPNFGEDNLAYPQHTMVQTIDNPDGTLSIIQIDNIPNQVVTLSDGTQAQVVHTVYTDQNMPNQNHFVHHTGEFPHEATQAVRTLADVATTHQEPAATHTVVTDMNQQQQLIYTDAGGGDGQNKYPGMLTIPVSMYQNILSQNLQVTMTSGGSSVPDAVQVVTVEQPGMSSDIKAEAK